MSENLSTDLKVLVWRFFQEDPKFLEKNIRSNFVNSYGKEIDDNKEWNTLPDFIDNYLKSVGVTVKKDTINTFVNDLELIYRLRIISRKHYENLS